MRDPLATFFVSRWRTAAAAADDFIYKGNALLKCIQKNEKMKDGLVFAMLQGSAKNLSDCISLTHFYSE